MFDPEYFIKGNCLQSSVDVCSVRYKMKFHNKKENVGGSSHIEEQEDGTFKLVWVHTDSEPPDSYPKFDIVRPGRYQKFKLLHINIHTVKTKVGRAHHLSLHASTPIALLVCCGRQNINGGLYPPLFFQCNAYYSMHYCMVLGD